MTGAAPVPPVRVARDPGSFRDDRVRANKGDPMVDKLLATREDIFPDYTLDGFRTAFGRRFSIVEEAQIEGVTRVLFRMTARS
jgi:hypothetical protein